MHVYYILFACPKVGVLQASHKHEEYFCECTHITYLWKFSQLDAPLLFTSNNAV